MPRETGGQAFPHFYVWDRERREQIKVDDGMTLRDWFAGQVVVGLVTGCAGPLGREFSAYAKGPDNAMIAERAYLLADILLAERAK